NAFSLTSGTLNAITLFIDSFFFFNSPPTTELYTLSLHDALPISPEHVLRREPDRVGVVTDHESLAEIEQKKLFWIVIDDNPKKLDRKSTRLNSSHRTISYAVFCLKKKKDRNDVCIAKLRQ